MPTTIAVPTDRPDLHPECFEREVGGTPPSSFPLLVAVAADECTPAVITVAGALASQRGASPTLLYVMELIPTATVDGSIGVSVMLDNFLDPASLAHDERALRAACGAHIGAPATWPFEIELGESASSIVSRARRMGAKLILMGLHQHGRLGRVLGADTLREVMALGGIPVLAVRPSLTELPKSIVVAMDFSRASLRVARLAREIMDTNGTMQLVFVETAEEAPRSEAAEGERLIQANGVDVAFAQVIAALAPTPGMTITPVRRIGAPVLELTAACEALQPDLFAIGSQRHPFVERVRLGSVAAAMAKDGRWSMLVTPPAVVASTPQSA